MPKPRLAALLLVVSLGACAAQRLDFAVFPPDIFGSADVDDAATADALAFFAGRSLHPPTPAQVARVLADVEYLAGAVNTNPRYSLLAGTTQVQMLQARDEVRQALAIAPATRSQQIVTALLAVARTADAAAQRAALATPFFTLGPQSTWARLTALPPMPVTRIALEKVSTHSYRVLDAM